MTEQHKPTLKLPKLSSHIILTVILIWSVMLAAQWFHDSFEKKEHIAIQQIGLYNEQNKLVHEIIHSILNFQVSDTEVAQDKAQIQLRIATNDLKTVFDQLQGGKNVISNDIYADIKLNIAKQLDQIILYSSEALALMEAETVDYQSIKEPYKALLKISSSLQKENAFLLRKLISQLYTEQDKNNRIAWCITFSSMLLVLLVNIAIYLRGKKQIQYQFNKLKEISNQLKAKTIRAKENEQRVILEAKQRYEQQNKLNSILSSAGDAIITITAEGIVDSFNKSAEAMFGYPSEAVIGQNIKMLMPEPFASQHDSYLARYQETGEKRVIGHIREVIGKRIDGSEFPLRLAVNEVKDIEPKLYTGIIRDITDRRKVEAQLQQTLMELTNKQAEMEEEERIARHVFENITASNNAMIPDVSFWCEPMATFSGDMMLSAILPSGNIRILLCDFTGHGLPAALGAVPVSTIHSAMAKKDLPLEVLMNELNDKLKALLPTGIFCCIAGIDLDEDRTQAHIWNAGLPDVLIVNNYGEITQRISSNHLPVGVVSYSENELHCQTVVLHKGDAIYMLSDGLTESENEAGELFGQKRFEQLLMSEIDGDGRLVDIRKSVETFIGNAVATDDISLIEIKTVSTTS